MPSLPVFLSSAGIAASQLQSQPRRTESTHTTANAADVLGTLTLQLKNVTSVHSLELGNGHNFNNSQILAAQQRHEVQILAACTSALGLTAALCAIYWFAMMRRNFRRDLVLLLILGDFWKTLWILIFAGYVFRTGGVTTQDPFCQASGYLLQDAVEACDLAILLMSIHMFLQLFPPKNSVLGHDGLYRIRKWVLAAWIILPNLDASLAFINSKAGYVTAGAFCALPIRPYWYRLALSWIPRYMIWIVILGVAFRIYRHVGKEFKVFGDAHDVTSSMEFRTESAGQAPAITTHTPSQDENLAPDDHGVGTASVPTGQQKPSPPGSTNFYPFVPSSRRPSVPNWSAPCDPPGDCSSGDAPSVKSGSGSRRGSKQVGAAAPAGAEAEDFAIHANYDYSRHRGSVGTVNTMRSLVRQSTFDASPALPPITEGRLANSISSTPPTSAATQLMRTRRRAIQRQLRLLFIYPCVYLIFWTLPFVAHAFNYNDYYAQHPVFGLTVCNIFCQTFLPVVDVSIFCWREKPWRHIPGSNGTFWGSFAFWRFCRGNEWQRTRRESRAPSYMGEGGDVDGTSVNEKGGSNTGLLAGVKKRLSGNLRSPSYHSSETSAQTLHRTRPRPPVHRRTHSGGSDRKVREAELAHKRLALERADWEQNRRNLTERRASVISQHGLGSPQQWSINSPDLPATGASGFQTSTMPAITPTPGDERREWWDRHMSVDLFNDKDVEMVDAGDVESRRDKEGDAIEHSTT
ncbi:hypothetical protein EJ03DRAFT_381274 [Teratosphaeria nubilosa]|uniref:Family A G protein-coupled receptor-like protein n=1 Tax=Teratosphaeria nubilosa TaxID=161662 RepID=A0A6G1LEL8_9PEZI|nr:hypothetical protein EJ03DRAFT_381274 [Teratosphaeria nubilosa]